MSFTYQNALINISLDSFDFPPPAPRSSITTTTSIRRVIYWLLRIIALTMANAATPWLLFPSFRRRGLARRLRLPLASRHAFHLSNADLLPSRCIAVEANALLAAALVDEKYESTTTRLPFVR